MSTSVKKNYPYIIALIALAEAMLYCGIAVGPYVWADEAYSLVMARHSFGEIVRITAADIHPPLYYFYLKAVTAPFGYSLFRAKLATILPCLFIAVFGSVSFRKAFGTTAGILFPLILFAFPSFLQYSLEIRMYTLCAAFVFGCAVYGYFFYSERNKKHLIMMSVFLVLSAYTHYYALLSCGIVFGIVFLLLLLKRDHDAVPVMAAGMIAAVLFLPWMPVLLRQMTSTEGTSWIGPITLGSIKGYIVSLFGIGGSKYSAVFFAAVHLAVFIMLFSGDRHDAVTGLCALRIPALTALTGVIVSLLLHPVFHIRYLTPCIPLICSFLTIALSKCRYRKAARIASAVIVLFGAAGYLNLWREEHAVRHDELDSAFVEKYRFCSCYVVETRNTHIPAVLEYYEQEKPVYWENEMGRANPYANRVSPTLFIPEENPSVVLFLNVGAEPSEDLRSLYSYDYIGTMHENSHSFDAYLLTLK